CFEVFGVHLITNFHLREILDLGTRSDRQLMPLRTFKCHSSRGRIDCSDRAGHLDGLHCAGDTRTFADWLGTCLRESRRREYAHGERINACHQAAHFESPFTLLECRWRSTITSRSQGLLNRVAAAFEACRPRFAVSDLL